MERMNQEQALSLVKRLTEWLERGMQDSENKICSWGTQANSCEKGDTSLTSLNLSKEQLTETRWAAGRTLGWSWERLSRVGVVEESTSLCLPNPLPLDFSIEYHLDKCKDQLNLWHTTRTGVQTNSLSEFLSYHFLVRWERSPDQFSPPRVIYPPKELADGKGEKWRKGVKDLLSWGWNGQHHALAGILNGGFLLEGEGDSRKEDDQVEKRGEEVWEIASETLGIGWSFLQGVGAPKETRLAGPSPSPTDTTDQELFTRELEVLRTVDVWCTSCGGRCTAR
jgi:hypothetical protein